MTSRSATSVSTLTRRRLLLGGAAVLAAATLGAAPRAEAQAQAQAAGIGAIRVDARHFASIGGGDHARIIVGVLEDELRRAFAGYITPGGPTLIVHVRSVMLNSTGGSFASSERRGGGFGGTNDYMETEAVLVGPKGQELNRFPMLSPVPAESGALWSPEIDRRRMVNLSRHNAGWIRRYIVGA